MVNFVPFGFTSFLTYTDIQYFTQQKYASTWIIIALHQNTSGPINSFSAKEKIKEHVGVNENFQHISLIYYVIETFVIVVLYVLEYAAEFLPFGG